MFGKAVLTETAGKTLTSVTTLKSEEIFFFLDLGLDSVSAPQCLGLGQCSLDYDTSK